MCDYCDCRSHPEIAFLSEDHERVLTLTAALRRALARRDGDSVATLVGRLPGLLGPHFEREERGVFERLRGTGIGDEYVDRFDREHDEMERLLAGSSSADTQRLVILLEDHILREETDMFPAAHQLLAPTDWDAIDEIVGRAPATAGLVRKPLNPTPLTGARPV